MEENLKKKTTKALVWSSADKLGQQLFYLVAGIILARQLSPTDYGKVGVLTIFIALSGILIDSGFSSALIRKKEATQAVSVLPLLVPQVLATPRNLDRIEHSQLMEFHLRDNKQQELSYQKG